MNNGTGWPNLNSCPLVHQLNIVSLFPPNRDDPINNKYMSFLKEGQAAA